MAARPVQISLEHKGKSLIRASVSEDMRGDQLLRAIARRLVEAGFEKVPLVKSLQKFHYVSCTCLGDKLTGSLEGELAQDCLQESKIALKDFAEFGAFKDVAAAKAEASALAEGKSRAASAKAATAQAKANAKIKDEYEKQVAEKEVQVAEKEAETAAVAAGEEAAAEVTLGYIDIDFAKAPFAKAAKKIGTDEWTIYIFGGKGDSPNRTNRFIAVTLLTCELGASDAELVLSYATPGEISFIKCKNGVLVNDVMAQIHKERGFDERVAVKLVTKDGALFEPGDVFNATKLTKEVSDVVPRLKMKAVLGLGCGPVGPDPEEDRLRAGFAKWDVDGNGEISASEMVDILTKLDPGLDATAVFAMVAQADANQDGVIDYDEFVTWIMK